MWFGVVEVEGSAWGGVTCVGKYRLLRELGRGGIGVVYLAKDERPQRMFAYPLFCMARSSIQFVFEGWTIVHGP